jgi:transposase InsO family protein
MTPKLIELRTEFVNLAIKEGANVAELCRRFKISRKTGYKWIGRYRQEAAEGLKDQVRRPKSSPQRTAWEIEKAVLALRASHPAWGPRKLKRRLEDLGMEKLPARSTLGVILKRHGQIEDQEGLKHKPWQRFERSRANELWQMDFKGDFALGRGGRCFALPIIDDHSRFAVGLFACANQQETTVRTRLEMVFERYGLPEELLCDNGSPWGGYRGEWSRMAVWLLRHGVRLLHGRPYHPQTQGKQERFNRTLQAEVLQRQDLRDLEHAQREFERWRSVYNFQRPHEALAMGAPATRYEVSPRRFRAQPGQIEYSPGDLVKKVKCKGEITWRNQTYYIGNAFAGEVVALRATQQEHCWEVYFCHQRLGRIDLRQEAKSKNHYLSIREPRAGGDRR